MSDFQIRPTIKFVRAGFIAILFVVVVAWGCYFAVPGTLIWIPLAASLLLLWPLLKWIPIRMNVTTVTTDRLHWEEGVFAKSTRTLMLERVQDVGVNQSFGQRLLGVGDIWIETAGASSRVVLTNIDAPQRIANLLLDAARAAK